MRVHGKSHSASFLCTSSRATRLIRKELLAILRHYDSRPVEAGAALDLLLACFKSQTRFLQTIVKSEEYTRPHQTFSFILRKIIDDKAASPHLVAKAFSLVQHVLLKDH